MFLLYAVNDSQAVDEAINNVVKDINVMNFEDGDGSLQLSETQSQSVDGTEPVTQAEDVELQLQLEDERKRKKLNDHARKQELLRRQKAALVHPCADDVVLPEPEAVALKVRKTVLKRKLKVVIADGMQRRSPHVKAALDTTTNKADVVSDAVNIGASTLGGSPVRRSPRVLVYNKPSASPLPERCSLKENKKCKVPPTKVNKGVKKRARVEAKDPEFDVEELEVNSEDEEAMPVNVRSPVKLARGKKDSIAVDEVDLQKLNITVRCSLKEIVACAQILKEHHVARVHKAGFGSIFNWKVEANISRPLMGVLYVKIDPNTMDLDMGEANKRLRITSDGIHQLFGFPRGSRSAPRPSEDGYDDALMRLRSELGISRSQDIKTKDLRDKLRVLVNDPAKDDLALRVFFIIVFMKVVLPSAATPVSREATMFEHLVIEDMANMDYCQLIVDELRRAVVRYQNGVTLGKAITGCAIGPVLMYLDCLIRGKVAEVDMRVPRLCFMDQKKLFDLVDADLIKKAMQTLGLGCMGSFR